MYINIETVYKTDNTLLYCLCECDRKRWSWQWRIWRWF